jgi:hypothetical protein
MTFDRVAFVDGLRRNGRVYWTPEPGGLRGEVLHTVLPCDALHWRERDNWDVDKYDVFLVFFFATQSHVLQWIRERRPDAKIIVGVDPGADVLLNPPVWGRDAQIAINQIRQYADLISTWDPTLRHGDFLSLITSVPAVELPIPLMPHKDLETMRARTRQKLIVGVLHKQQPQQPAPTLATLAAIQRDRPDYEIVIFDDVPEARAMARNFRVKAEWLTDKGWPARYELIQRAKLVIDMYTIHHYGRVQAHAANVGTLSIGSTYTADVGHVRVDPWSGAGTREALNLLEDATRYYELVERGFRVISERHDPERTRAIVRGWIDG